MPVSKIAALTDLSFGQRVAEEEISELGRYFVQTDQWQQLLAGDADVVYGPKGAGKSALYATLIRSDDELTRRGILLIAGENPRGTPVFKDLVDDPPTSEQEFRNLWKLYFLQLIGERFREQQLDGAEAREFVGKLEESQLLPKGGGLRGFVRAAIDYVRHFSSPAGISGTVALDPITGMPAGLTGKITFREPSALAKAAGAVSADRLFALADEALVRVGRVVWILLDRLDVAFVDSQDLEQNALRALFMVYSDLRNYDSIAPKIFLRTDIWERITAGGFREASHITRALTISWDEASLLNLVVRRILQSSFLVDHYSLMPDQVLGDVEQQIALFYRVFPAQVDVGTRRPTTFDWVQSRTRDGTGNTAPRELIHLLSEARAVQMKKFERGESLPSGEQLISGQTLKEALIEVSRVRVQQTLFAEYPKVRPYIQKLRGAKTQQSVETLTSIWGETPDHTLEVATLLTEVGFFERRGTRERPEFWVPFLYRDALDMSQGTAE
jgi:hypothetical protein